MSSVDWTKKREYNTKIKKMEKGKWDHLVKRENSRGLKLTIQPCDFTVQEFRKSAVLICIL